MSEHLSRRVALSRSLGILASGLVAGCKADSLLSPPNQSRRPSSLGALGINAAAAPIVLVGAGDQHSKPANLSFRTGPMVKAVLDRDPNAWAFALGDLTQTGTAEEMTTYHKAWGSFRNRTCFIMGNHDHEADPTGTPYYNYCGELAGPRGKGYYARTLGSWRVYFLNSEYSGTEQNTWLAQDLPLWSNRYHIAAMWHTPMFASVCAHNAKAMVWPSKVGPWWDILVRHGAEFVASGHVHRWERFPRMLRNGTVSSTGIRQFLTGVGGVNNMDILTVHPLSQVQVITKGIVKFTLHSDRYEWSLTDLSGVVRDSGSQACRKTVSSPVPPDTIPVDTIPQDTTCS